MDTDKTKPNNGSQPKLFKICVKASNEDMPDIELNVHSEMKIEEIKKMVFEKFIELQNAKDKYLSYEKYDPKTDKDRLSELYGRLHLSVNKCSPYEQGDLWSMNETLQRSFYWIDFSKAINSKDDFVPIIYHHIYIRNMQGYHKFICSSPTVSFEFVEEYDYYNPTKALGLYWRNSSQNNFNISILKERIYETFQSNASVYIKKKGVSEYLKLEDDEPVPPQDIYIKFNEEPKIADKLQSKLSFTRINDQYGEVELQNIKVRKHAPKDVKEYFENFTSARKENSNHYHKEAGIGGALAGFINTFIFSSLCRNCLPNIVIRLSPNLILGGTALSVLGVSLLGMCTGGVIGAAASYIYNKYFHNNKTYEVERTVHKDSTTTVANGL